MMMTQAQECSNSETKLEDYVNSMDLAYLCEDPQPA